MTHASDSQGRKNLLVSFCCNDERGLVLDHVTSIHLPCGLLDLESVALEGVGFREVRPDQIKVSRRAFRVHGYTPMYGNVFWNGYALTLRDTLKLLVYLRESGKWSFDGGHEEMCAWWERGLGYDDAPYILGYIRDVLKDA